ncbi:hypothetical protein [Acidithiobacillus caldus]|uniref:Beta sliding clamp n=2 Tax=Acidithiobacillus caldus TaxID=33059 RepID=F9ZRX1_ACICS|nr:hypothetical protein [Acidithiobacillus caldus]AEK58755.1 hypothetical protein Atc_2107 [Acidithiobacillus caldus SM-1]OFC35538.1 hypothetical protein BAE29_15405 [Acidithiobacillus caldus]OFC36387.1 hypothetical protein BAE27_06305 [Acidithiobacillus caldus]OFC40453.1 hypothetical protein BAE28_00125 [Acidithiobacillus caldus]OFC62182.1 hypothetical protein BAE30_02725 [Acidithiobacillus caldus]
MQINKAAAMRVIRLANIVGESGFDFSHLHFMALMPSGKDNELEAYFANNTITAKMRLPLTEGPAQEVCLPKKEVLRFLAACGETDIAIQVHGDTARLNQGKSRMVARTIPVSGFPFPLDEPVSFRIPITARNLQAALYLCCGLASSSHEASNLDVHLALDDGLQVYTTDGKNLAHAEIPLEDAEATELATAQVDIGLSVKTANTLLKLLDSLDEAERVILEITERSLVLHDMAYEWSCHCLLKAESPAVPWRRVAERQKIQEICSVTDIAALQDSMEVCMAVSDDKYVAVMLTVDEDALSLELENEKGSSTGSTTEIDVVHPHRSYVPFLPLKTLLSFCQKFQDAGPGQLRISKIELPQGSPLKWDWLVETGLKNLFIVTAAYLNK